MTYSTPRTVTRFFFSVYECPTGNCTLVQKTPISRASCRQTKFSSCYSLNEIRDHYTDLECINHWLKWTCPVWTPGPVHQYRLSKFVYVEDRSQVGSGQLICLCWSGSRLVPDRFGMNRCMLIKGMVSSKQTWSGLVLYWIPCEHGLKEYQIKKCNRILT